MAEYICFCGKKYTRKYGLDKHIKKVNTSFLQESQLHGVYVSQNTNKTITYPCENCNKVFNRKYNRDRHQKDYCSKKTDIQEINSYPLESSNKRSIPTETKALVKQLATYCSNATNKNVLEIIKENHLELYYDNNLENLEEKIDNSKNNKNNKNNNKKSLFDILEDEDNLFSFRNKEQLNQLPIISKDKINFGKYEPIITESTTETIDSLQNNTCKLSNTSAKTIINNIIDNSSNVNNTHTNININNNNNICITTQNNFINDSIPFVYPFGYENINFLKQEEMLDILKSVKGSEAVVDKIYSHISNQNFINQNQKKFMVTVIDKDNKTKPIVRYYKLEDFGVKLYQNSIELLMRLYHKCHTRLSVEHQLIILSNIKHIEEQLMNSVQHYDTYDTIITGISNNGMRRRYFTELKRNLEAEDPETTKKIKDILESQFEELAKYHEDLSKRSLTKEEIHQLVWQPAEDYPEMDLEYHKNDLRLHRVIETPRYLKRKELEQSETALVQKNGGLMGDVETIYNLRESRGQDEASILKESYELKPEHLEEINEVFSNKPNNMLKLQTVKLTKNKKIISNN